VDDAVWRVTVGRDDPVKGPRDALVTLVVFSDFECPFCRNGAGVLESLLAEYPAEVRLVWKDLPLPMHAQAESAAELARAARAKLGDDGFWRAHALLYESQATLGDATYERIAKTLGLPWGPTRAAIRDAKYAAVIREGVAMSDRVDVPATPTTFVNGRMVVGAQAYAVFKTVIDEEVVKAKELLNRGVSRADLYAAIIRDGREVPVPTTDAATPGH
jgi:protein-disulfide isomerase